MGNTLDCILPGLHIGSLKATELSVIRSMNITHVVSVCDGNHVVELEGVEYLFIKVPDLPHVDLSSHFSPAIDFIHTARKERGTVLVHCMAGISRSATVTLAYMLVACDLSLDDCMRALKAARSVVNPNEGFMQQLREFEKGGLQSERDRMHPHRRPADTEHLHQLLSGAPPLPPPPTHAAVTATVGVCDACRDKGQSACYHKRS